MGISRIGVSPIIRVHVQLRGRGSILRVLIQFCVYTSVYTLISSVYTLISSVCPFHTALPRTRNGCSITKRKEKKYNGLEDTTHPSPFKNLENKKAKTI